MFCSKFIHHKRN